MPKLGCKEALCFSTGVMENRVFSRWGKPHNVLMDMVVFGISLSLAILAQERLGLVGRHCGELCAYDGPSSPSIAQVESSSRCIIAWKVGGVPRGPWRVNGSACAKNGCEW